MLAQVLIAEADSFVAMWKDLRLPDGRDRVVRHGHGPHRAIQTGAGPVEVRRAKVRDRGDVGAEEKIRFTSSILPKWARRTKSLDALLPVLCLRGVSTGDFQEVLTALLGKDAPNLSPAVITRLTAEWQADYDAWQKRDLSAVGRYLEPLTRPVVVYEEPVAGFRRSLNVSSSLRKIPGFNPCLVALGAKQRMGAAVSAHLPKPTPP